MNLRSEKDHGASKKKKKKKKKKHEGFALMPKIHMVSLSRGMVF